MSLSSRLRNVIRLKLSIVYVNSLVSRMAWHIVMTNLMCARKRHRDFVSSSKSMLSGTRTDNILRRVDRPRESVKRVEFAVENQLL